MMVMIDIVDNGHRGPVTKSIVTHVEASFTFTDFFERFHAAQHDGLQSNERLYGSDLIPINIDDARAEYTPDIRLYSKLSRRVSLR